MKLGKRIGVLLIVFVGLHLAGCGPSTSQSDVTDKAAMISRATASKRAAGGGIEQ